MSELPEMENIKQLLSNHILNKPIESVQVGQIKSINVSVEDLQQELLNERILHIERRAKYLLFHLSTGKVLLLHLMLGGRLFYGSEEDKPNRSTQITISFGNDQQLYFIGLRSGYLHLLTHREAAEELSQLGPEPLKFQFTYEVYTNMTAQKRGAIKTALVDQTFIAGIGNCYADEICFHAGMNPLRKWPELSSEEHEKMYEAIQVVLREATERGGYMEDPLFIGDEHTGGYIDLCKVYDKEGQACERCEHPILKETISSKRVFYCNHCQQ